MTRKGACTKLALCSLILAISTSAAADDWPQWLGPLRNGQSLETGLLQYWPEEGPPRKWLFENCGKGYSGPAIVDGRIYILGSRDEVESLICLDAEDGQELWSVPIGTEYENGWGNGPRSTPTVDGDLVYALGAQGDLLCADRKDGREIWRVSLLDLGGTIPKWGYSESVLIDGDWLLCTPGGSQGAIAALDKNTGSVIWQATELDEVAHYASIMKAQINGQPQYVQLLFDRLVGLSTDGMLLWEVDWPGRVAVVPTPIVQDNLVYVSSGYGVGCMLVEIEPSGDANVLYDNKMMKNHHGGVVQVGDYVYGYSDGVGWLCQNLMTGERAWRERDALGKGAVTYADGMLYCVSEDEGTVVLTKATTNGWEEQGRFTLEPQTEIRKPKGKVWTHPVIADGCLYLRDQDLFYCYDISGR